MSAGGLLRRRFPPFHRPRRSPRRARATRAAWSDRAPRAGGALRARRRPSTAARGSTGGGSTRASTCRCLPTDVRDAERGGLCARPRSGAGRLPSMSCMEGHEATRTTWCVRRPHARLTVVTAPLPPWRTRSAGAAGWRSRIRTGRCGRSPASRWRRREHGRRPRQPLRKVLGSDDRAPCHARIRGHGPRSRSSDEKGIDAGPQTISNDAADPGPRGRDPDRDSARPGTRRYAKHLLQRPAAQGGLCAAAPPRALRRDDGAGQAGRTRRRCRS